MSPRRYLCLFGLCLSILLGQYGYARTGISVEITGIDSAVADNILAHLGELDDSDRARPQQLQRKIERAVSRGSEALGYYRNEFTFQIEPERLILRISPGIIVHWDAPEILVPEQALRIPAIHTLVANHPFTAGKRIKHSEYDSFKRELVRLADESGFVDSRYTRSQLRIDLPSASAKPLLHLNTGERYRVSAVEFDDSALSQSLLRKFSPLATGDFLQRREVITLQRNLRNSLYFSEVSVDTDLQPPASATIIATLRDAPRHQFGVGAGFGTDTGPRARLNWHQPRLNRHGHRLRSEAKISEPIRELGTNYRIPLDPPMIRSFNAGASWTEKRVEDTRSQVARLSSTISDQLWQDWRVDYGAAFEWERYEQGDQPRETVGYLIPGINLTYLDLPSVTDPLFGRKLALGLQGSSPSLGADTQFVRATAYYKQLVPLGGRHLLIARAQVGVISTDNFSQVPASKRFFTGGDQTVRGYGFETLAPTDDAGELTGGKYLNVASLEYSLKVAPQWRAALFSDAGRAYDDDSAPWHHSAGFGVRWLSPLGQIRADIAFRVDDQKSGARLHIFMGPPL